MQAKLTLKRLNLINLNPFLLYRSSIFKMPPFLGVFSSVGRASPLQGEGRGFEPLNTHQETPKPDLTSSDTIQIK